MHLRQLLRLCIGQALFVAVLANGTPCRGSLFPAFTWSAADSRLEPLYAELDALAHDITRNHKYADKLPPNVTSFSIQVTSASENLWSHHYSAPLQGDYGGSGITRVNVTSDTKYRIASVSKTFTVLSLLLNLGDGMSLDDPITKYVPALRNIREADVVQWKDVTLRALASQLSGIGRQYGFYDMLTNGLDMEDAIAAGLPSVTDEDLFPCGDHRHDSVCEEKDMIHGLATQIPTFEPSSRSTYSNDAYSVLGFALNEITGETYEETIKRSILDTLGMANTSTIRPPYKQGIIPVGEQWWHWDSKIHYPTGGIYSTSNDLSKYIRSILTHQQLSAAQVNAWLQPASYQPGMSSTYGMPWEIFRIVRTSLDGRAIPIYTKGGGLPGYSSLIVLVPEYGIGFTVLVAGGESAKSLLADQFGETLLRGIERAAQQRTAKQYSGHYQAQQLNSSLTISSRENSGLVIDKWISNGTDFLDVLPRLHANPPLQNHETMEGKRALLLPVHTSLGADMEAWRLFLEVEEVKEDSFLGGCFYEANWQSYGNRIVNEFIFRKLGDEVVELDLPAFRVSLQKTKGEDNDMIMGQSNQQPL